MKRYRVTSSTWPIFKRLAMAQTVILLLAVSATVFIVRYNHKLTEADAYSGGLILILVPFIFIVSVLTLFVVLFYESVEEKRIGEMKGTLITNIGHEVKTPLTAIKGHIQILLDHPLLQEISAKDPEFQKVAKKIERNVDRLGQLFSDILSLSGIESKHTVDEQEFNLRECLQEIADNLHLVYKEKNMTIECVAPDESVLLDRYLLEHILINLLDNALKYTPSGKKVSLKAFIKDSVKDHKVRVVVSDTGIGIPDNSLQRVFERFFRVDPSRSRDMGGTGLGLSIVKHAVQKMEGTITVESDIGKGTTFIVDLPHKGIS
jgi:two-component system, OmpR family, phosphate regulon sensor histidine kinase PhoR